LELSRLDARLAQSEFLADGGFSIADITMLVAVDFMKPVKLPFPDQHAHIMRWYKEVSSRPSASA
jgi:glutathione S-transferase